MITDDNGISIYLSKPKEGQLCQTKRKGTDSFHGKSIYTNGHFETYREYSNRFVITRWEVDFWLPVN